MNGNKDKEMTQCANWSIAPILAFLNFFNFFFKAMTAKLYLQGQGIQAPLTEQRIHIPLEMKNSQNNLEISVNDQITRMLKKKGLKQT